MFKLGGLFFILLLTPFSLFSQDSQELEWNFLATRVSDTVVIVDIYIDIPKDSYIYSFDQGPGGPLPASFNWILPGGVKKTGDIEYVIPPHIEYDDFFNIKVITCADSAHWQVKFKVLADTYYIATSYRYQFCNKNGLTSFPPPKMVRIPVGEKSSKVYMRLYEGEE